MRVAAVAPGGSGTAVAYDLTGAAGEVAATLYLHPAPTLLTVGQAPDSVAAARARACVDTLDARLAAIRQDHLLITEPKRRSLSVVKGGRLRPGTQITSSYSARFAGRTQTVRTELDLFCDVDLPAGGAWTLEFRFSTPAQDDAAPRIAAFMGALDWEPPNGG